MAIQCIYRDLEYAKSLVKAKAGKNATRTDDDEETEESWTFVGDDMDAMQQSVILSPEDAKSPSHAGVKPLGTKVLSAKE